MKGLAATLGGNDGIFEIEELEVPAVEPGTILVRNTGAAVCGSDLHQRRNSMASDTPKPKKIPGHEFTGTVHSLGKGVTTDSLRRPISEGDRLVFPFFFPCMRCINCLKNQLHACAYRMRPNMIHSFEEYPYCDGGFSQYFLLQPNHWAFKVPEELHGHDPALATVNCSMAQVMMGIHLADVDDGDTVVVQGAGGLGIYATAIAAETGASQVIVIDGQRARLDLAMRCGATSTIDLTEYDTPQARVDRVRELTGGVGADKAIEVVGVASATLEGLDMIRTGGTYIDIGNIVEDEISMPASKIIGKQIRWIGLAHYNPWVIEACLRMLLRTKDKYPLLDLVSHTFPLNEIQAAFELAEWHGKTGGSEATRVVVTAG